MWTYVRHAQSPLSVSDSLFSTSSDCYYTFLRTSVSPCSDTNSGFYCVQTAPEPPSAGVSLLAHSPYRLITFWLETPNNKTLYFRGSTEGRALCVSVWSMKRGHEAGPWLLLLASRSMERRVTMIVLVLSPCPGCSQPVAMVVRAEATSWPALDRSLLICLQEVCFPRVSQLRGGDSECGLAPGIAIWPCWWITSDGLGSHSRNQIIWEKTDALDSILSVNSYNDLISFSHAQRGLIHY